MPSLLTACPSRSHGCACVTAGLVVMPAYRPRYKIDASGCVVPRLATQCISCLYGPDERCPCTTVRDRKTTACRQRFSSICGIGVTAAGTLAVTNTSWRAQVNGDVTNLGYLTVNGTQYNMARTGKDRDLSKSPCGLRDFIRQPCGMHRPPLPRASSSFSSMPVAVLPPLAGRAPIAAFGGQA